MATAVPKNDPSRPNETLPIEVVWHVLWYFGDLQLGVQPGSFTTHLLRAFGAADSSNTQKLWAAFPDYGLAFHLCSRMPHGLEQLRDRAKAGR